MTIIYAARSGYKAVLYGCMTTASSWDCPPTAPPASLEKPRLFSKYKLKRKKLFVYNNTIIIGDRYTAVSYGFINLILSNCTHIPLIPSVPNNSL